MGAADGADRQPPHEGGRRNEATGEGCEMLQRTRGVEGMEQTAEARSNGGATGRLAHSPTHGLGQTLAEGARC
jgi:hypothetical protein